MVEIRIHGRGAQGAVTSAQVLAVAAFYDGKESQAFPTFGPERCGAPVESFVRISDEKINIRSQIYKPDYSIVLDPSLVNMVNVTRGLKKLLLVNTKKDLKIKGNFKVYCIDITSVAVKIIGRPFVNIAILGAFSALTNLVSLNSILKAVEDVFELKPEVVNKNKEVVKEVYKKVKNEKKEI